MTTGCRAASSTRAPSSPAPLGIGLLFALISYVGFEATAIFRDEAKTPERTIPRATYIALILIGVFYAVTSWALISGWGDQEAVTRATDSGATFLADTAQRYIGVVGTDIITVLYFTSLFACILSFHNVASRYIFALSQRDVLPESLSRPHDRARFAASGVSVDLRRGRDQRHRGCGVQARPCRAVLHLVRRRYHGRVRRPSDRHIVAVLVYFARDRRGYSQWRVRIAPALGLLGLAIGLVLILVNLKDLVGGSTILGWAIVGLLVVAFIAGVVVGTRVGDKKVAAA